MSPLSRQACAIFWTAGKCRLRSVVRMKSSNEMSSRFHTSRNTCSISSQ